MDLALGLLQVKTRLNDMPLKAWSIQDRMDLSLTPSQSAALRHVEQYAQGLLEEGHASLVHVLKMSNVAREEFEEALQQLTTHGRVGLHFHPDRFAKGGKVVAQALLDDGVYKNQFET